MTAVRTGHALISILFQLYYFLGGIMTFRDLVAVCIDLSFSSYSIYCHCFRPPPLPVMMIPLHLGHFFHQGGLMEQSNTSLQRGCQNFCGAADELASQAHRGPVCSRAVHPYSHPLQLEQGVSLAGLSSAHFDGICSTT